MADASPKIQFDIPLEFISYIIEQGEEFAVEVVEAKTKDTGEVIKRLVLDSPTAECVCAFEGDAQEFYREFHKVLILVGFERCQSG